MRYIRTEDGIYEIVDFDNECIIKCPIIKMDGRLTHCSDYEKYEQADTIEELIQDDDLALFFELKVYCDDSYYEFTIKNALMSVRDARQIAGWDDPYGHFKIKDIKELYIKNGQGKYIKVAQKETKEGKLKITYA